MLLTTKVLRQISTIIAILPAISLATPTGESTEDGVILNKRQRIFQHHTYPDPPPPGCQWKGTAPFCDGQCDSGWRLQAWDRCGDGLCCKTGQKVLCCQPWMLILGFWWSSEVPTLYDKNIDYWSVHTKVVQIGFPTNMYCWFICTTSVCIMLSTSRSLQNLKMTSYPSNIFVATTRIYSLDSVQDSSVTWGLWIRREWLSKLLFAHTPSFSIIHELPLSVCLHCWELLGGLTVSFLVHCSFRNRRSKNKHDHISPPVNLNLSAFVSKPPPSPQLQHRYHRLLPRTLRSYMVLPSGAYMYTSHRWRCSKHVNKKQMNVGWDIARQWSNRSN